MSEKKPVSLIVSDVDNTISDYFNNWGLAWDKGIEKLAESRGMEKDKLYEDIRNNAGGYARFHNFPDLLKETPSLSLEGKSAEERARLEKNDAKICHEVAKQYHEGNTMYEGVIATIRKAKAMGAQFVLYSDSPASGLIARMADMQFPLDLVDGVVCRADSTTEEVDGKIQFKKAPMQVTGGCFSGYRDALVEKLGDKLVMNAGDVWKPNMEVMQGIMDRHGATPDQTVMVGDNIKSDGGVVRLGCHFAWQKEGSEVCPEAQTMYSKINEMTDYKIGAQAHLDMLDKMSKADPALGRQYQEKMVTLEGGFKDLNKYYRFQSAERAKAQAKAMEATNTAVQAAVVARRVGGR
ncbi:MAG: HAD hydrolase-like protein [Alphaproteobacteria bacterium]|nr:HAD hydrolase-like protein [Alphaproteobacteria bacterium]